MRSSWDVDFEQVAVAIERMLDEGTAIEEEALLRQYPRFQEQIRELLAMERLIRPQRTAGDLEGRVVGNAYRLIREIGRGGMGRVFEAEQSSLNRRVAVKILDKMRLRSTQRLDRFRREAAATAFLSHPGILPIHDFGVDEELDAAYLVMDLVDGVTFWPKSCSGSLREGHAARTGTICSMRQE